MSLGRVKLIVQCCNTISRGVNVNSLRRSHFYSVKPRFNYRDNIERDIKEEEKAQHVMTGLWAWLTYYYINHFSDFLNLSPSIDPTKFSDAELGVA
uniref:Uncharacterized protein n=1 Tax=Trichobilharzia regenti TaxID=157069 RepID=A0AA85JVX7_TRIRE|nr:unnamed protein product [Trichobilharzia regenti]